MLSWSTSYFTVFYTLNPVAICAQTLVIRGVFQDAAIPNARRNGFDVLSTTAVFVVDLERTNVIESTFGTLSTEQSDNLFADVLVMFEAGSILRFTSSRTEHRTI